MTDPERPIGEDDLHAYVDHQLDDDRRGAVERYLEARPHDAHRVAAFQAQREALRAAFAARETDPLPPTLDLSRIVAARVRRRRPPWLLAASVALALAGGSGAGWVLHTPRPPDRTTLAVDLLKQEALTSHRVYADDSRHPVEMSAADQPRLGQWLSDRLRREVVPANLSALGFDLIGGRLLATEHGGAAALLMYQDARGDRLSLLLRPMARDLRAPRSDVSQGPLKGSAWIDNGLGYAVVAALPNSELDRVADTVRSESGGAG